MISNDVTKISKEKVFREDSFSRDDSDTSLFFAEASKISKAGY